MSPRHVAWSREKKNLHFSYAERPRGTRLCSMWHCTYFFLLTVFGISFSFPPSSLPSGARGLIFAYTPSSPCPWGPGGNTSHLPCPLLTLQIPLMAVAAKSLSNSAERVDIWLLARRFTAQAAVPIFGEKAGLDRNHLHFWFWCTIRQDTPVRHRALSRVCSVLCNWRKKMYI